MANQRWNLSISEEWTKAGILDIIDEWKKYDENGASEHVCEAIQAYYYRQKTLELSDNVTFAEFLNSEGYPYHKELPAYDIDKEIRRLLDIENPIQELDVVVTR